MISNLLSFLTNENIYLIANWGVIPFWLLLIFLPYHQLTSFFTQSIIPFLLLGIGYAYLSYGIFLEGNILDFNNRKNLKHLWVVDPLDGTKEFIKKNNEFTKEFRLVFEIKKLSNI